MRTTRHPRHARRTLWSPLLAGVLITTALSAAALSLTATPAQAANVTVSQCNDVGPGPAGATTGMNCTVDIVNTINSGTTSSTVTLTRQCSLDACPGGNGTFTSGSADLVTLVDQCNRSANDAAHPITCTVNITNNISSDTPGATATAATVNQCVGSAQGGGGTINCSPFPANTTNATVTQCNGSANGGGGTVDCAVGTSTVAPAIAVRVNQCNGTGNPGGSVVRCRTTITTNITAAAASPTPTSTATGTPTATPTATGSPTGTPAATTTPTATTMPTATITPISTTPVPTAAPTAVVPPGDTTSGPGETTTVPGGDTTGAGGPPQVTRVPTGGVQSGGGSTAGLQHRTLIELGGILLLTAALVAVRARRAAILGRSR